MACVLRFNGNAYSYKGGRLVKGDTAEFSQEDAIKLLTQTTAGLWTPINEDAIAVARDFNVTHQIQEDAGGDLSPSSDDAADDSQGRASESDNQCTYIKADGTRCKGYAMAGIEHCFFHKRLLDKQTGPSEDTAAETGKGAESDDVKADVRAEEHIQ